MPSSGMLRRVALVRTDVVFLRIVLRLLVTNKVPSSLIPVTLMIEPIRCFEMSVLTRATRRNISVDGILHGRHRENLKSYTRIYTHTSQVRDTSADRSD
jgi:hypothetical protein